MKLQIHRKKSSEIDAQKWDAFIRSSPQATLSALYGYAAAAAPDWELLIVEAAGEWQAVMPISPKQKWGMDYLLQPVACRHWGIYFANWKIPNLYKFYSLKQKIVSLIAEELSDFKLLDQYFSPTFDYPLPFHWQGYQLQTRYTYQLEIEASAEDLLKNTATLLRRKLKKSSKQPLSIKRAQDESGLFSLLEKNIASGRDLSGDYKEWRPLLGRIYVFLSENNLGEILELRSEGGELLAAAMLAHFEGQTFYLAGAQAPGKSKDGNMHRLLWESILRAQLRGSKIFDFEGSMLEGIEGFFRQFGAKPIPYLQIKINRLPLLLKWIQALK